MVEGASMTTGSGGELLHRFDRCPERRGQGRAARPTKGDREWVRGAKGGQPEKSPGWDGGGASLVAGAWAEGPAEEVAAEWVVGTPVLGGGVSGGSGTQFACVVNEWIKAWVRPQIWSCWPELNVIELTKTMRRNGRSVWFVKVMESGLFWLALRM